jgi:hypothetical protein
MGDIFRPLPVDERNKLREALRRNAEQGTPLRMDPATTGWTPEDLASELESESVINAIRSVPCHYADSRAVQLALVMLRGEPGYIADARAGAPVGNSVVGSLLSLLHGVPRQYAEPAVMQALAQLDREVVDSE